jgi:hypothetical protein
LEAPQENAYICVQECVHMRTRMRTYAYKNAYICVQECVHMRTRMRTYAYKTAYGRLEASTLSRAGETFNHRNLSTSTRMFELLLQTFCANKNLVKSLLISTLDKVIYCIGTVLQGSKKPLFTSQNRVETS